MHHQIHNVLLKLPIFFFFCFFLMMKLEGKKKAADSISTVVCMTPVFLLYLFLFPYDIAYVEMVPVRSPAKLEKLTFNFTAKGFCCCLFVFL